MPNPDFPAELGNIPYDKILGAPLSAAVEANAEASKTAANFIKNVGFQQTDSFSSFSAQQEPVYVTFYYKKQTTDSDTGTTSEKEFEMRVPLLLLLHVPYFEVETVTVDLNVKLHSVQKSQSKTEGGLGGTIAPLSMFFVSGSYQRTDKQAQTIKRTYDQSVHIEAGSIEPPEGVTRLLDVLGQTITETPEEGSSSSSSSSSDSSSTST